MKAVISGIGESQLGLVPGRTTIGLHVDAVLDALSDSGLSLDAIDGVLCVQPMYERSVRFHMVLTESLGMFAKTLCDSISMGGASPCAALQQAVWAVESGLARNVLVVAAESLRSSHGSTSAGVTGYAASGAHSLDYEFPYGAHIPAFYALVAQRYLHEYAHPPEGLAPVAVAARRHAGLNPKAQMQSPITIDDVMASKLISSPLRKLDCSLISDGGGAFIVSPLGSSANPRREIEVLGLGQAQSAYHMGHLVRGDGAGHSLTHTVCDIAARRAFGQAGLTPRDIDVAQIYDSFTITVLLQLEDLGFCERGEAVDFVADGGIELGGLLPTNTHGGLLSCAHPGVPGGMLHLNEAVRQLRGEAGLRQVAGAQTALVTSASAVASNFSLAILGTNHHSKSAAS